MSKRKPKVRASSAKAPAASEHGLDRRRFLTGAAGLLVAPLALRAGPAWAAHHEKAEAAPGLAAATRAKLASSEFVYISPLKSDGVESRCHGEVWYGWFDGAVYITTGNSTWKSRALARGLDRAKLWVGDYGRWRGLLSKNEAFRQGPELLTRVSRDTDPAAGRRLLAIFAEKYPDEFPGWKDRMERGHETGERWVLRYEPVY